jgi:hypothetical protein
VEPFSKNSILKLLVIVTERERSSAVNRFLGQNRVPQHYQFMAEGTATSEWTDLLGVGGSDKTVSVCLGSGLQLSSLLSDLVQALKLEKPGNGIAFLLPLSGASKLLAQAVESAASQTKTESEVKQMKSQAPYDMIWAILNQGYSEELMSAARKAGAAGGTVISARSVSSGIPMKFWGISVQDEKEIIFILADKEHKLAIMQAISKGFGMATEAQGIVFSLPVEEIVGVST